ncbi:DMSO/selenate family reductase complex B subunit [Shewanella sp. TC10]|uniref:DMSO/selenate family reductase complex B subunit n=1 Tax=Shewanella sp. TC10 TaxID=1419739 RepID=UPI00129E9C3D|nr:DMSO/selenate family reductase complex B subunit [Shewanella sp. TC10]
MTTSKKYGFYFDAEKCSGCKTCQVICKDKFQANPGVSPRRVYEYAGGDVIALGDGTFKNNVFAYYTSVGCNHCDEPVCVKACPTGACFKEKETGLVSIEQSLCIGCSSCAQACPYDAPQLDTSRKVMVKCDGCYEEVKQGKPPLCVQGCTQRAMDFGDMDELMSKYPNAQRANFAPLPQESITTPNLLINPCNQARPSGSSDGAINNWNEV